MSNETPDLERQLEQLIQAHIDKLSVAAEAAVARAFMPARRGPVRERARTKPARTQAKRRTAAELAALRERFHTAVRAAPGETMHVLAPKVGASAADLQVPVAGLKRYGLVRSVGHKHRTRFFPASPAEHALEVVRGRGAR